MVLPVVVLLLVVVAPATAARFPNPAPITVADCCDAQASSPYGTGVSVAGLAGTVTKVTATLSGLTHGAAGDLDVLLVGPAGQKVLLLSDTGVSATAANVTFDQAGAAANDLVPLATGSYQPTNSAEDCATGSDAFPAPAPAGPYGSSLNDFNGSNPIGTWTLYVVDDCQVDAGAVASGFSLSITTTGSAATPFSNNAAVTVGDCCVPKAGSLYPSTVSVSGTGGTINGGMAVQLLGLTHNYVADLNVLLVGPGGQKVMLSSDAGRAAAGSNLTFSDAAGAGNGVPAAAAVPTGVYLPTNLCGGVRGRRDDRRVPGTGSGRAVRDLPGCL